MNIQKTDTAVVFIEPQNDVLSEKGSSWGVVEVAVVKDATAGPRHPVWGDGYQAAMINYQFLAHAAVDR